MIEIDPSAVVSRLCDIEDSVRGTRIVVGAHSVLDSFVKIKPAGGRGDVAVTGDVPGGHRSDDLQHPFREHEVHGVSVPPERIQPGSSPAAADAVARRVVLRDCRGRVVAYLHDDARRHPGPRRGRVPVGADDCCLLGCRHRGRLPSDASG